MRVTPFASYIRLLFQSADACRGKAQLAKFTRLCCCVCSTRFMLGLRFPLGEGEPTNQSTFCKTHFSAGSGAVFLRPLARTLAGQISECGWKPATRVSDINSTQKDVSRKIYLNIHAPQRFDLIVAELICG